jgi:hypothetical protein
MGDRKEKISPVGKAQNRKERENTGKEIQKWEFELSRSRVIAILSLSLAQPGCNVHRSALQAQQFDTITTKVRRTADASSQPPMKRWILKSVSSFPVFGRGRKLPITFSYVIPNTTNWRHALRCGASREKTEYRR